MLFDKRQIKGKILGMRNSLPINVIEEHSEVITSAIQKLPEYMQSRVVFCYVDFGSEVRTGRLIENIKKDGKIIAVPLIEKNKGAGIMAACEVEELETELLPRSYGIREPDPLKAKRLSPCKVDLAIVPGTVFDEEGNRIGYGAGYYDRFLGTQGVKCVKIGIAFDFQIVEAIPTDCFDIPMDIIITEKRTLRCNTVVRKDI